MAKLRILIADDHAVLREGLTLLVNGQPDMEVVAQAATGAEAVRLVLATRPDIAVLDVSMPEMGGAQAAERIRVECPHVRMIALTRHSEPAYVRRLFQAGASGYVVKRSAADGLLTAIRAVAADGVYVEPDLADPLLRQATGSVVSRGPTLGDREEQVLREIAWARSNKEIAAELNLSIKTVESYKAGALEKLGLRTRGDVVRYAVSRGWLDEDNLPG